MHKLGFSTNTGMAVPEYQDLTFIADLPGSKTGRIRIFGLWGTSFISMGRDLADTTVTQYNARGTATDFGAGLGVIGVSHTLFLNKDTRLKSTFSLQQSRSGVVLDSVNNDSFSPFLRNSNHEKPPYIIYRVDPPFSGEVMVSGPKSPEFRAWLDK